MGKGFKGNCRLRLIKEVFMMYLPEIAYVLSTFASAVTLYKTCKLSKVLANDPEVDEPLKKFENVAFLKVTASLAICTLIFILMFFGLNDIVVTLTCGFLTFYITFVYDDVKNVHDMVDTYLSGLSDMSELGDSKNEL